MIEKPMLKFCNKLCLWVAFVIKRGHVTLHTVIIIELGFEMRIKWHNSGGLQCCKWKCVHAYWLCQTTEMLMDNGRVCAWVSEWLSYQLTSDAHKWVTILAPFGRSGVSSHPNPRAAAFSLIEKSRRTRRRFGLRAQGRLVSRTHQ